MANDFAIFLSNDLLEYTPESMSDNAYDSSFL